MPLNALSPSLDRSKFSEKTYTYMLYTTITRQKIIGKGIFKVFMFFQLSATNVVLSRYAGIKKCLNGGNVFC